MQYTANSIYSETYLYGSAAPRRIDADDARLVAWEGGGASTRSSRLSNDTLVRRAILAIAGVALMVMLGCVAVFMTSNTVAVLQANSAKRAEIQELVELNDDLRIECSLLSRSERISQIATQNLGMVYASEAQTIVLD